MHKDEDPSQTQLCSAGFAAIMVALTAGILAMGLQGRFAGTYYPGDPATDGFITEADGTTSMVQPFTANALANPMEMTDDIVPPPMTYGSCTVDISPQEAGFTQPWCNNVADAPVSFDEPKWPACYPLGVPNWHAEDNIIVTFPNPFSCQTAISDTWRIAGWYMTYIQLAPGATFTPPPLSRAARAMLKVIRGSLLDVGENGVLREDGQWETFPVTPPLHARSLRVPHTTEQIRAGAVGAAFIWFLAPEELLNTPVTSMTAPPASLISGPFSDLLQWRTFSEATGATFEEFWNLAGILVNNYDGSYLHYNQWWTVREDNPVDGGYHSHDGMYPNNTFAELHMTMYAATAGAGMQTQMPNSENSDLVMSPGEGNWYNRNDMAETQLVLPMPPGYSHGPLWSVDTKTGRPEFCPNGGVKYPWHRLVLGTNPDDGIPSYHNPLRYQLWQAFEHPPQYVTIPEQMLTNWHNAYLQNKDGYCMPSSNSGN